MVDFNYTIEITCSACKEQIKRGDSMIIPYIPHFGFLNSQGTRNNIFVAWNDIIVFPKNFPKEVQQEMDNLYTTISGGELHLKCYMDALNKLNRIFELKAFI